MHTHAHARTHTGACAHTLSTHIHYMSMLITLPCLLPTSHFLLPCLLTLFPPPPPHTSAPPPSPPPLTHSALAEWNLPACIEETGDDAVPESILEKSKAVKEQGGLAKLDELMSEMPELVTRNKEILAEVNRCTRTQCLTHMRIHTHMHTHAHTHAHACSHTCARMLTHMRTHAHTHAHACSHTNVLVCPVQSANLLLGGL